MSPGVVPPIPLEVLASFDFTGHDEQSIREQWVFPLLLTLGYGIGTVHIPFKVDMRAPVRALGSKWWEIDYMPTVHGKGMWIIEAKAPAEDLFSERHIGQAWGYATHPRVNVPFMALANGNRICVFDVTQEEWDVPILDISQRDLSNRFADLNAALGARTVADFARRRQLGHLRTALRAQLDEDALDQTIADVKAMVDDLRPIVKEHRAYVASEAWAKGFESWKTGLTELGVFRLAFAANSLNVVVGAEIAAAVDMIRGLPAEGRAVALGEIERAALVRGSVRMTFSLRVLLLAVALRLVSDPGCSNEAKATAEKVARDGANNLQDDKTAASAHRFEMALAAFVARVVLNHGSAKATAVATTVKAYLDVETWLRQNATMGLGADAFLARQIEMLFRRIWDEFEPWTPDGLDAATNAVLAAFRSLPARHETRVGPIGNEFYESHLEHDPLRPGVRNVIWQAAQPPRPEPMEQFSEETRSFARWVLAEYFDERVG